MQESGLMSVRQMKLEPKSVVVIQLKRPIDETERKEIHLGLERVLGRKQKVLVLQQGAELSVVHKDDL